MILALATPDHHTHLWLFRSDAAHTPVDELEWESGRALSDQLLAKLTGFLENHATKFEDLTGIVVFSGPGSFTSLRIGHTTANALAGSLAIPILGLPDEDWLVKGLAQLSTAKVGVPALPYYGADANITKPKS